ncbi:DUF6923 family protein [Leucobacter massiliensis]|uniref:DUF7927 domain-containing protein n=1 Tax=Leucobacter massiliensis TaxID=1686285 RepID=UPI0015E39287|nr:DUF11 domain-containing protein [Leucobacter massiliensis]
MLAGTLAVAVVGAGMSLASFTLAPSDPAHAAPGDAFSPAAPTVFIAQETPTQLQRAETTGTGKFAFIDEGGPSVTTYNAIGFNTADNYIYGMVSGASSATTAFPFGALVRVGQDGVTQRVGTQVYRHPDGTTAFYSGAFNPADGLFYVGTAEKSSVLAINVATGAQRTITLSANLGAFDFSFKDGFGWGADATGTLFRYNFTTGEVRTFPNTLPAGGSPYGASWTFGNGNLGFSDNGSGDVFQLAIQNAASNNPTFTVFPGVDGPHSSLNDGTAIPGLPADLSISKTGPASFTPGNRISYDVRVTNNGEGVSSGWTVTDSLPAGLTNPTVIGNVTPNISGSNVTVSGGRLGVDQSITFRIEADANANPSECIVNGASVLGNEEDPNAENNTDDTRSCAPGLSIAKTSSAGADSAVGDVVDYEITLTNTSEADFTAANPASFTDDLTRILDDATFNNDLAIAFSEGTTSATPTLDGTEISWSGPLLAGETATITYSVTVTNAGDGTVLNTACIPEALSSGEENCASTTTELPKLTIAKTSSTSELPTNGGTVNYQITITNQGPGDATASNPASFEDDLSDVLDDGDFVDGSLTASSGTPARDGDALSWSGPLAAGDSVTVSYDVEYDANKGGTKQLVNVACLPVELAQDPSDPCRQVQIPGAALQQWKTADPSSGNVAAGEQITYTLHFRNTGQADATVENSDDLSAVLDDANLVSGPSSSGAGLSATLDGNTVRVSGAVPPGGDYTVSYTVEVRPFADRGDSVLTNALAQCEANDTALCDPIEHRVPHLSIEKSSDVETARTGDTVTYSIEVTNDGTGAFTADAPASFSDDLTGVLDDASYGEDAQATSGTVSYAAPTLSWEGALAPGESATVTYSVVVTNEGDHQLLNVACAPNAGEDPACADNAVLLPHFVVSKSVDPASGTKVDAGQVVRYTLSFENDGTAPGGIDYRDDLADVLDDAEFGDGPTASDAALTAVRDGENIGVTGTLAAGQAVTVDYTVTVKPDGERGNNRLGNVLADSDNPDPACGDEGVSCTENPIGELTTWKSVDPASGTTLRAGDTATYTLHFENTGTAPVDVARDDVLTAVLDDADVTTQPEASSDALTVSPISDGRFTVTGSLDTGAQATVTYTVTVKADGSRGDDRLGNFLVPQGEDPPAECVPTAGERPNCTVNPVSAVFVEKSSNPDSGASVEEGQNVTYTLTFTNRSESADSAPAAIDYTDYMKDVLDDATLTAGPAASSTDLTAVTEGNTIRITGSVPYGEVYTVSYTVKVKAYDQQGDHQLDNVVAMTGVAPVCTPDSPLCTQHNTTPPKPGLPVTGGEMATAALWTTLVLLLTGGGILWIARRRARAARATENSRHLIE